MKNPTLKNLRKTALKRLPNVYKKLYVLIMSRTPFRVNPHSIVALMSRNSLLKTGMVSEV